MIITRHALPRRTVLRGLGTAVALPLLDGMVPALTALERTAAKAKPRLGVVYVPHGAVMDNWTPAAEGRGFEFSPILQPLEPFRDRLQVLTGLDHAPPPPNCRATPPAATDASPARSSPGCTPSPLRGPTSGRHLVDQIAARVLGRRPSSPPSRWASACPSSPGPATRLQLRVYQHPVLEHADDPAADGEQPAGALRATLRRRGHHRPRGAAGPAARKTGASSMPSPARWRACGRASGADRAKLTDYLAAVRDVERRIQRAEAQSDQELPVVERPSASVPASFSEYVKVMFDLQVLAYQTDMTRVVSFLMTPELTAQTYPEIGVPDPHHALSHHENKPESLAKLVKVGTHHTGLFAYYLDRLRATPDGDGSLLDQVMVLYGSGMSNSNLHNIQNLPDPARGRRGGAPAGEPPHPLRRGDPADQPLPVAARQAGRAGRAGGRQHRPADRTGRRVTAAVFSGLPRGLRGPSRGGGPPLSGLAGAPPARMPVRCPRRRDGCAVG